MGQEMKRIAMTIRLEKQWLQSSASYEAPELLMFDDGTTGWAAHPKDLSCDFSGCFHCETRYES